ncbi:uncharacterized protein PG986_003730 [Apiospora aurea]|uniref:Six-hairpin glycosidase-like protein n=1 Tax=Apiospora aurea TaxID=335848 RepID=A0ABR1QSP6_9PEZI
MRPYRFYLAFLGISSASAAIDREAIVSKFNVVRTSLIGNTTTPLQVGNGDFAFNVDNTGMQVLSDLIKQHTWLSYILLTLTQTFLPFNTLSTWAWHNDSLPTNGETVDDYSGVPMLTHGRNVSYDIPDPHLPEISQWLIGNPNRINLGRICLKYKGQTLSASCISEPRQELNLWTGCITSKFQVDKTPVEVVTQGDLETDAVAFEIESDLVASGELEIELDFPTRLSTAPSTSMRSSLSNNANVAHIYHEMQETKYFVNLRWDAAATSSSPPTLRRNELPGSPFKTAHRPPPLPAGIRARSSAAWPAYWREGGFVDVLTGSTNPNATELQRRIILSQYHVRVNSASRQPPQESGLVNNGWYGKFHMEMVVWHGAHWATWGHQQVFEGIFPGLYERFLESSVERARHMGWEGARWPKMTDPITGRSSPGGINGLLMWQQLAYWQYGLGVAQHWKALLGRPTPEAWTTVSANLASLPTTTDPETNRSYYAIYEGLNDGWWTANNTNLTSDPRSVIMLQGILPDLPDLTRSSHNGTRDGEAVPKKDRDRVLVDPDTARATSDRVWGVWRDERIRGWGRPVLAMNAARVGRADRAVYHLTAFDYWHFDDAGQ